MTPVFGECVWVHFPLVITAEADRAHLGPWREEVMDTQLICGCADVTELLDHARTETEHALKGMMSSPVDNLTPRAQMGHVSSLLTNSTRHAAYHIVQSGGMFSDYQEYRSQAIHCQQFAERAITPELRADWLRLAQKWLEMIPLEHRSGQEAFNPLTSH